MSEPFHDAMSRASVSALWERTNRDAVMPDESPHLWRWAELSPLLDQAVAATDMAAAERRVLMLENPAYRGTARMGATINMTVNLQVLMPGESARPHRHRLNALRFIIESENVTTTVDGIPVAMHPGDLLLTPGWCWHEHAHAGGARAVWLDALDSQLQRHLCTNAYEQGPSNDMPPPRSDGAWVQAGITPLIAGADAAPHSPTFRYPLDKVREAMDAMPAAADGSRRIRYTDPRTGGAAMPGIDCYMLAPGRAGETRPYRTNANMVCLAVAGEGTPQAGDETLAWRRNDIFVLPRHHWIAHVATSDDALLFQLTDREVLRRLDYLREEFRD